MTELLGRRKHKRRDEVTEQHISLLLNCGLLTRHLTQKDTYWFALAGIGPLIKSLVKGRKVMALAALGSTTVAAAWTTLQTIDTFSYITVAPCALLTSTCVALSLKPERLGLLLQDLLGMLSKRRYPEMFVKELEQKKLGQSLLDSRFHMRDLVGLGSIAKVDTTSGPLLRIVKH